MEEINLDEDNVRLMEEEDKRRKRKGKKPPLIRQRTQSEVREDLGLSELDSFCRSFGVFIFVFSIMASIGGVMQLASSSNNKVIAVHAQEQQELNVSVAKEVFVMACQTTWVAAQLWARLIVAIVLPTSHQTFRITKDGFSAMQPSIRASWNFFLQTHWTTKLAMGATALLVILAFILQREVRKRRYVERVMEWYTTRANAVQSAYDTFANEVRRESRMLADLLPHLLFFIGSGVAVALFRTQLSIFSRGLGGWAVVIGLPALFSTRALIVYDLAYRKKVEKFLGQRRRTLSHFPTPDSETQLNLADSARSYLSSFFWGKSSEKRRADSAEDDSSSVGSFDSTEVSSVDGIKYPRQLEDDPEASLEQYEELRSVIYWLQYWCVLSLALVVEQMPLTGHMLSVLPFWPPARLLWSLWLQLPGTSGASLAFEPVVPIINQYLGDVSGPSVSIEQQNLLVNVLFAFRLIGPETRVKLAEVLQTGGTVIMFALPFLFLPSLFTGMGAIFVGIGRPLLSGTRVIVAVEHARKVTQTAAESKEASAMKRFRSNSISITNGAVQVTQWVEYWVVYSIAMLINGALNTVLFWFPFYQHMVLLLTLWLQLPYFRGAHNIFKVALKVFYKIRSFFVNDSLADFGKKKNDLSTIQEDEFEPASPSTKSRGSRSSRKRSSKRSTAGRSEAGSWYERLFTSSPVTSAPASPKSVREAFLLGERESYGKSKKGVESEEEDPIDEEELYDEGSHPRGGELEFLEEPRRSRSSLNSTTSSNRNSALDDPEEEIRRLKSLLKKAEKKQQAKTNSDSDDQLAADVDTGDESFEKVDNLDEALEELQVEEDEGGDEEASEESASVTPRNSTQKKNRKSKKKSKKKRGSLGSTRSTDPSPKAGKKGGFFSFFG